MDDNNHEDQLDEVSLLDHLLRECSEVYDLITKTAPSDISLRKKILDFQQDIVGIMNERIMTQALSRLAAKEALDQAGFEVELGRLLHQYRIKRRF
jgi:hypothetical protein